MKYRSILALSALLLASACGGSNNGSNNGASNNGASNNGASNNGATNNGASNNGATNNGASNNGASNNGASNNGASNNGASNNGASNNGGGVDFISADVDGTEVLADAAEGGVEPMGDTVQLRKTTGDGGMPTKIFRISVPNTDVASYDCANDDVSIIYSELNGQLIANWTATETCTIEVTAGGSEAGDVVVGSFTASATDGNTTVELTNGAFSLTR